MTKRVTIARSDSELGSVEEGAELDRLLESGFRVVSEDEANTIERRREASSVGSVATAVVEETLSGATLGLSDLAEEALGVDMEKSRARRENVGTLGTIANVAGGVGAAVLTGGASTAGAAAAGAKTVAKRSIAKRALGAVTAPTRLATRAGDAAAGLVAGGAEASLKRQVAARVFGGGVEGALGGMGGVVSESVLQDKELTAEALLGGAAAGAVFGGALDGGGTAAFGGLARGAGAARSKLKEVMSRDSGIPVDELPDELVDIAAKKEGWISTAAEKLAPLSGADPAIAKRVYAQIEANPRRVQDLLNRGKEVQENIAETFQGGLQNVRTALDDARLVSQGEAKYSTMAGQLPQNADFVAPRITEQMRQGLENRVTQMAADNAQNFGRAYDVASVREVDKLVKRAFEESTGGTAMDSFRAMDRFKRDLALRIEKTGGWGKPKIDAATDVVEANKALRDMHREIKTHLEREDLWGAAARQQKELNGSYAASAVAQAEFKKIATGSGVRGLFSPDGTVNLRQAISLAKQFRRQGGSEVVSKFDEVLDAQLNHLNSVKKHYDLGEDQLQAIKRAEDSVAEIREKMALQADDASLLDDLESLREAEGNRSVSMSAMSTLGPSVGGMLGFSMFGGLGAAVGAVGGAVTRPYSSARTMASLLAMGDKFKSGFSAKKYLSGAGKGLGKAVDTVKRAGQAVGRKTKAGAKGAVVAGAFQVGKGTFADRQERIAKLAEHVSTLGDEESLRKSLGPTYEALAGDMPELAAAFEGQLVRAQQYLDKHRPKVHRRPYSGRPPAVNPVEAARFERRWEAVTDPLGILDRLHDGRLTIEHVDALREVYPRHYQSMVDSVHEELGALDEKGEALPYRERVKLSILLGAELDSSMSPQHRMAMAAVYGGPQEPAQEPNAQTKSPSGKIRAAGVDKLDFDGLDTPSQTTASGRLRA